jgi:hypothetical protein
MKSKIYIWLFICITLLGAWSIVPLDSVDAMPQLSRETIATASQLINVVNSLCASYGLAALTTHSATGRPSKRFRH